MKRTMFISLLALAPMVAVSTGCATSQMAGEQRDDNTITRRVAMKLAADPDIRKYNIDVDTLDNEVTLSGDVESERDKKEAEQIARDTLGVEKVNNELNVGVDRDLFDDNPDGWITSKVKSQLAADLEVRAMDVDVDTDDRVVTLRGMVNEESQKKRVEEIARNTEGVEEVRNELEISDLYETQQPEGAQIEAQGPEQQRQQGEQDEQGQEGEQNQPEMEEDIEFEGDVETDY